MWLPKKERCQKRKDKMIRIIFPYKEILYKQVMWSTQRENCQNKMMSYQRREIMWHGVTTSTYRTIGRHRKVLQLIPAVLAPSADKPPQQFQHSSIHRNALLLLEPPQQCWETWWGRKARCIDGINTTIYYYEISHNHMIWSHDWLTHQLQHNHPDGAVTRGPIWSIATDGKATMRKCQFTLCMSHELVASNPLYCWMAWWARRARCIDQINYYYILL